MHETQIPVSAQYSSPKHMEFVGLGAMDVTKSHKFKWFGDIYGPMPYKFIGSSAMTLSHASVLTAFRVQVGKTTSQASG